MYFFLFKFIFHKSLKRMSLFNCKSLIIGHRGANGEIMENTLESILRAIELGVDGVEFDVHRCSTKEIILFHDDILTEKLVFKDQFYFSKTKGVPIQNLQWYHLYNTELIDSMGKKYKIPKLVDILYHPTVIESDVLIDIDIKDVMVSEPLTDLIFDLVEEGIYDSNRFFLSSHSWDVLIYLSEFKEDVIRKDEKYEKLKIGWVVSQENIHDLNILLDRENSLKVLTHLVIDKDILNQNLLDKIKNVGLRVYVYTINSKSEYPIPQLDNIIEGIITDKPSIFK